MAYNIKKKWIGTLNGTALDERGGGVGSGIRNEDDEAIATNLLELGSQDLDLTTDPDFSQLHLVAQQSGWQDNSPDRRFLATADGILYAWRCYVYATTEAEFQAT